MRVHVPSPETWTGEQFAVLSPKSICARNTSISGGAGVSLPGETVLNASRNTLRRTRVVISTSAPPEDRLKIARSVNGAGTDTNSVALRAFPLWRKARMIPALGSAQPDFFEKPDVLPSTQRAFD